MVVAVLVLQCLDQTVDPSSVQGVCLSSSFSYNKTAYCDPNINLSSCSEVYSGQFYKDKSCSDLGYTSLCGANGPATLKDRYLLPSLAFTCENAACVDTGRVTLSSTGTGIPICKYQAYYLCGSGSTRTAVPGKTCPEAGSPTECKTGSIAGYFVNSSFFSLSNASEFCVP